MLRNHLVRTLLAVAAVIATSALLPATSASAAGREDCFDAAAQSYGRLSYGYWNGTSDLWYPASKKWCAYNSVYNTRIVWQPDGNLVMYNSTMSGGAPVWASNTNGRGLGINFQRDGNVVIYGSNGALWATNTWRSPIRNSEIYQFKISGRNTLIWTGSQTGTRYIVRYA